MRIDVLLMCCLTLILIFFYLRVWQGVADVLELLISGGAGHKQTLLVPCSVRGMSEYWLTALIWNESCWLYIYIYVGALTDSDPSYEAAASDRGMNDGDMICQFLFKDTVKILTPTQGCQAVAVDKWR